MLLASCRTHAWFWGSPWREVVFRKHHKGKRMDDWMGGGGCLEVSISILMHQMSVWPTGQASLANCSAFLPFPSPEGPEWDYGTMDLVFPQRLWALNKPCSLCGNQALPPS